MEMISVNSSNIAGVGYEDDVYIAMSRKVSVLRVVFKSGEAYDYYRVPKHIYNALVKADSAGMYFHKNIKNKYNYEKVKK